MDYLSNIQDYGYEEEKLPSIMEGKQDKEKT